MFLILIFQESSIAATLRDDILRGQYRCGERLPSERDLAQRFGVHRSTVREAFKRLEQLGVATIQRGGARVAPLEEASLDVLGHLLALDDAPDPEIVDQALEALSGFRAMAARLATERASEAQRARMVAILEAMMAPDLDARDRFELVTELGECFVAASDNIVLRLIARGLPARAPDTHRAGRFLADTPRREAVDTQLRRLRTAIQQADGAIAAEAVYRLSGIVRQQLREEARS